MNNPSVEQSHNGIYLVIKRTIDTHNNMDISLKHYVEQKKPDGV